MARPRDRKTRSNFMLRFREFQRIVDEVSDVLDLTGSLVESVS